MVYFSESPRTCFGEIAVISPISIPFCFHTCECQPPKKIQRRQAKHTISTPNKINLPTGKIVSCQPPTLKGLNHFALNWAFNEPKSGEQRVNSVVYHHVDGGGLEDDFWLADVEQRGLRQNENIVLLESEATNKSTNYDFDLKSKD